MVFPQTEVDVRIPLYVENLNYPFNIFSATKKTNNDNMQQRRDQVL